MRASLAALDAEDVSGTGRVADRAGARDASSGEHSLEETRSLLSAIVDTTDDAIITSDLTGTITSWNRGAARLYGYGEREMIGRSIELIHPEDRLAEAGGILERIRSNETVQHHETRRRREDGTLVEISLTVSPVRDQQGRIVGLSKIARDLSERRRATDLIAETEAKLRQAQKLDAIGRLAGGIAHDFNNLLSVILSYCAFLLDDLPEGSPSRADVTEIESTSQRACNLTRQLLAFSRQQVLTPQIVDVNALALGLEHMFARTLGEHVELSLQLAPQIGNVFADPSEIEQVIMNLVVNARDAMPSGGVITLETANVRLSVPRPSASGEIAPGPYVMLSVKDSGTGIDEATSARIFEPFFTTKELGKGTGLGLATVFGIVTQSGGYIALESSVGVGTTFRVYLPRTERREVSLTMPPPSVDSPTGTEAVLLVEDDDTMRRTMRSSLSRYGYRVLEAQNGGEALLISEQYAGAIDLLVSDVLMPRMSGLVLAERIALQRPETRVLFVSGHTSESILDACADGGKSYLQKPFTPESLARKVREVLDVPTA